MTFVLIMWLTSGYGAAMSTQEFANPEACYAAGDAIVKKAEDELFHPTMKYVCVTKG